MTVADHTVYGSRNDQNSMYLCICVFVNLCICLCHMAVADHTVLGSGQDENSRIAGRVERYRLEHAKGSQSYGHRGALMPILSALIAGYTSD